MGGLIGSQLLALFNFSMRSAWSRAEMWPWSAPELWTTQKKIKIRYSRICEGVKEWQACGQHRKKGKQLHSIKQKLSCTLCWCCGGANVVLSCNTLTSALKEGGLLQGQPPVQSEDPPENPLQEQLLVVVVLLLVIDIHLHSSSYKKVLHFVGDAGLLVLASQVGPSCLAWRQAACLMGVHGDAGNVGKDATCFVGMYGDAWGCRQGCSMPCGNAWKCGVPFRDAWGCGIPHGIAWECGMPHRITW
eukprot:scaffold260526_cov17-Tisochrysis_lutea.AAC.1